MIAGVFIIITSREWLLWCNVSWPLLGWGFLIRMLAAYEISKCPYLTIVMKITAILTLGSEVTTWLCHYFLCMQAFTELSDAEQSSVISLYRCIHSPNRKTSWGLNSLNYFDVFWSGRKLLTIPVLLLGLEENFWLLPGPYQYRWEIYDIISSPSAKGTPSVIAILVLLCYAKAWKILEFCCFLDTNCEWSIEHFSFQFNCLLPWCVGWQGSNIFQATH